MADLKTANEVVNDGDTKVEAATVLADTNKGEISPAADQSNRGAEMAARMTVTTPKVKPQGSVEVPRQDQGEDVVRGNTILKADGTVQYIDPDDLEKETAIESFPTTICVNCRNHGHDDVKLDKRGFCSKCGFKLNKIANTALEPDPAVVRN